MKIRSNEDCLSDVWLFEEHSEQTVRRWINNLHYFYFKRAWGGFANDGDEFEAWFSYTGEEDLLHKMQLLGIEMHTIPEDAPQPVPGKSYTSEEYMQFKSCIRHLPHLEQPGHQLIAGQKMFVWIYDDSFSISVVSDKPYHATENGFESCLMTEAFFNSIGFSKFTDKTEKSACYISKQKYPELFIS